MLTSTDRYQDAEGHGSLPGGSSPFITVYRTDLPKQKYISLYGTRETEYAQGCKTKGRAVMFWTSPTEHWVQIPTVSFMTARLDQDKSSKGQCLPWEKPGFRGPSSSSSEPREKIEAEWKICIVIGADRGKKSPTNVPLQFF